MTTYKALILGLTILFSGCASRVTLSPSPLFPIRTNVNIDSADVAKAVGVYSSWRGTVLDASGNGIRAMNYQQFGETISGEYGRPLNANNSNLLSKAVVEGTIVGEIIDFQLKYSTQCIYTVSGSIRGDRLTAQGQPTYCPHGSSFELDFRRY